MVTRRMHLGKETTLLEQNFVMVLLIFCLWWLDSDVGVRRYARKLPSNSGSLTKVRARRSSGECHSFASSNSRLTLHGNTELYTHGE